ncbi:hypothetical protein AKO1_013295 [Acrasis kona]|uniref:Uncharacterized protein n=1 Tax=Acrasis kona TaxID=1008807 RepID=A0AAW2YY08_9EUKA
MIIILCFVLGASVFLAWHFLEYNFIKKYAIETNFVRQNCLITGGSSGIGLEIARFFIRDGFNVFIISIEDEDNTKKAKQYLQKFNIHNVTISFIHFDLSSGDDQREELWRKLTNNNKIKISHLVNNAGFGVLGPFSSVSWQDHSRCIEVNVRAMSHLSHMFIRQKEIQVRRIMHTSSIGSLYPCSNFLVYGCTKSFIKNMSYGLRCESNCHNQESKLTITTLLPGVTSTPLLTKSKFNSANFFNILPVLSAEDVAQCAYYHMMCGHSYAIPGLFNKFVVFGLMFCPEWISSRLSEMMMRLPTKG